MRSKLRVNWEDGQKALDELAEMINKLHDAVNQSSSKERTPSEHEKIRVIEKTDGSVAVQFKSKNGWVESDSSTSTGFKTVER